MIYGTYEYNQRGLQPNLQYTWDLGGGPHCLGQVIRAPQNRWFNARNMAYICGLAASHFDGFWSAQLWNAINIHQPKISSQHCLVGGSSLCQNHPE